jgi:hypothetical protein
VAMNKIRNVLITEFKNVNDTRKRQGRQSHIHKQLSPLSNSAGKVALFHKNYNSKHVRYNMN